MTKYEKNQNNMEGCISMSFNNHTMAIKLVYFCAAFGLDILNLEFQSTTDLY